MTDAPTIVAASQPERAAATVCTDDKALAGESCQDPTAFAELYRRHVSHVYRYLLVRVGDTQVAHDLTAQTFLAALEHIRGYRGQGEFVAWLLGIARRKVVDHSRRERVMLPLEAAEAIPHPDPLPEDAVGVRLRLERTIQVMRVLAPDRAEALVLRVFGGLSAAEAGRVMGKSEAAVKMLVHRGIRDLRERLTSIVEAER